MTRRVFYSFHYAPDSQRASQIRNAGVVEGNPAATDNAWETVARGGDAAIKRWIDEQLEGRTCCVVLVGAATAQRKWIDYEIAESWKRGLGLFGVHIHNLKNLSQQQSTKGVNPFAHLSLGSTPLSSIVKCYDPPHGDSKQVYAHITSNLPTWIEEAISIRGRY